MFFTFTGLRPFSGHYSHKRFFRADFNSEDYKFEKSLLQVSIDI